MDRAKSTLHIQVIQDKQGIFKIDEQSQVEDDGQDEDKFSCCLFFYFVHQQAQEIVYPNGKEQQEEEFTFAPGIENQAGNEEEGVMGFFFKDEEQE
jgi:hypothetical protein